MTRRPKTNRVERTRAGGEWTEAAFWSFIRSGLREMSRKWPPLIRGAKALCRRPYTGANKRQKWEYQCAACEQWLKDEPRNAEKRIEKSLHVDHIEPCGTLKSFDDLPGFVSRLFCEASGLQVLCSACHQRKTNAERKGKVSE